MLARGGSSDPPFAFLGRACYTVGMRSVLPTLLLLWSAAATAQERAEKFEYDVQWGYADVAQVDLQRGCPRDGYRPARLLARSLGVAEQIHSFEIRLDSFADLVGRTLEGRTFIEEQGVPRRYQTRFAADGSLRTQKHYKSKDSTVRLKLRPGTYDLLSWFFALRAAPLQEGAAYSYFVWDGWKLTRVVAVVGGTERMWTPAGTFDARRVALSRERLFHSGTKAYQTRSDVEPIGAIWFGPGPARTPVAMDFRAPVGMAKLRLARQKTTPCP